MITLLLFIFGGIFICYDILLICYNPGTFWDNVFAFSHIWTLLGGYLIFTGIYRKRTGKSFWSSWKKSIKIFGSAFVGVGVIISAVSLCFILNPVIAQDDDTAEFVILLGGGIDKNGKLPKSVQNRVNVTAEYLQKNQDAICVVTGGTLHWLPYAEAPEIKRQLVAQGIVNDRILVEDQALDTIQNFDLSCRLLAEHMNCTLEEILESKVMIITSHFHLRRAERLAARMGFKNIKGLPAKADPLTIVHIYVREICAYLKLNLRILLTGKPDKIISIE